MPCRRIDPRSVKLHRSYTAGELASLLEVHKNTVRNWQREGLTPIDGGRPALFHGSIARDFLSNRNADRKSPCPAGTMYCFKCRGPREPAGGMLDFIPMTATGGNLRAICATCETIMHRRAATTNIAAIMPGCDIQFREASSRLNGRPYPSVNCDLEREASAR